MYVFLIFAEDRNNLTQNFDLLKKWIEILKTISSFYVCAVFSYILRTKLTLFDFKIYFKNLL